MHVKDLADLMNKDSQVAVGDGAMPIPAIFRQLQRMGYKGGVMLEYEINADNPLPGMQKSFAYMRGVLAGMKAERRSESPIISDGTGPARSGSSARLPRRESITPAAFGCSFFSFSRCSLSTALRLSLILLPSSARTLTRIWSPSFSSSRTSLMRFSAISLMCSRPSVPGKISTNAPKSTSRTTLPR